MKLNLEKIAKTLLLTLIFVLPFNFHYIFNFSATQDLLFFKENLQYSLYFFDLLFLIIFPIWLFKKLKTPNFLKSNLLFIGLIVYLLGNSFFISSDFSTSLYNSLRLIEVLFFFLIFIDLAKNKKFFNQTVYLIFLAEVIQAILALFQFIFQKSLGLKFLGESILNPQTLGVAKLELHGEKFIRGYGTFPHPNLLGAFLFLALICGLSFILKNNFKIPFSLPDKFKKLNLTPKIKFLTGKIHFQAGLFLILTGIIITFSRSVWLITALLGTALFFQLLFTKKYRFKSVFKSVFPILIILMFLLFSFAKFIPARLCFENCQDQSATLRQNYSQFSQKIIDNNFLTGIGPGQFVPIFKKINPQNLPDWNLQPVHNIYLLAWGEIGLIGFLLLFFFILKNSSFSKINSQNQLFLFLIIGFLLLGFFDHYFWTLPQGQFIFWLSLALFTTSGKIRDSM